MAGPGNAINETTTGICGFTGTGFTATPVTNHAVIVGAATSSTLTNVTPSATSGVALISQGAASDPTFGTVVVAGGGTGATTLTGVLTGNGTSAVTANAVTQNGVLYGGASNAVSSLAVASTGTVLIGNTGAAPSFSATPSVTSITLSGGTALSSYVQGTFSPTVIGTGTAGTATYTNQSGRYTRIGNRCFFDLTVSWNTGTGTGNLTIGSLPFTVSASSTQGAFPIICSIALAANTIDYWQPVASTTTFAIGVSTLTTAGLAAQAYVAAGTIFINGHYEI